MTIPASAQHHHSSASGLLTHSVDVAKICMMNKQATQEPYQSLLICAALLHDIGKIWTHNPKKSVSMRKLFLHEPLALEILAAPLKSLEHEWEEGANAMRYLLTFQHATRQGLPVLPIMNILKMADQLSSAIDVETKAKVAGGEKEFVRHVCPGPKNEFWQMK